MELQHLSAPGNTFLIHLENQLGPHLFDTKLTVRKMLRIVFMSRTNLHRKLRKEVGMSATEFIRFSRLTKAKTLLLEHPDWSIFRVSLEVGFFSPSYFSRQFKKVFRCPPKEWRKRNGP